MQELDSLEGVQDFVGAHPVVVLVFNEAYSESFSDIFPTIDRLRRFHADILSFGIISKSTLSLSLGMDIVPSFQIYVNGVLEDTCAGAREDMLRLKVEPFVTARRSDKTMFAAHGQAPRASGTYLPSFNCGDT